MHDVAPRPTAMVSEGHAYRDPSLVGLAEAVARYWWIVVLGMVLSLGAAIFTLRMMPAQFTATMVVGPTTRTAPGMVARLPHAAAIGSGSAVERSENEVLSDFARFLQLLASAPVAGRVAEVTGLLPAIFSGSWRAEERRWAPPDGFWPSLSRELLALTGRKRWEPPDATALARHLRRELVIDPIGATPMRRVSFRHPDREVGLALLASTHRVTDELLRTEAARRTTAQIAYLEGQLRRVTVAEHRQALAALLSEQEQNRIVIAVDLPFAADVIEPPTAPILADWPNPLLVCGGAAAAGLCLGIFGAYARHSSRQSRHAG